MNESVPSKSRSETFWTSLIGGPVVGDEREDLLVALRDPVRVAVRLQVVQAADAGVGHDRGAGARLDRVRAAAVAAAVGQRAVEGVVAVELMTHLVGHVVDGEVVADRRGQAGAAARLVAAADDAEAGDAAARVAHRDVADVVVARRR